MVVHSHFRRTLLFIGLVLVSAVFSSLDSQVPRKPNIIYILADDLGYGDIGVYGQSKIETPNIDRLAAQGMLFTQHYAGAPVCAPSRCILLTGKHSGHAQVRGNDEWDSRGDVWNYRAMLADSTLEGQQPMATGTVTIARLLHDAGYKTGIVGKWGLGAPQTQSTPLGMGFDFFFGYNCQRQAHTYYPVHLYKNDHRVYLRNNVIPPDSLLPEGTDLYNPDNYAVFNQKDYAPDLMFRELTSFVNENAKEPFFLYWATPIPHAALQASQKWIDYYVKKFDDEEPYDGKKSYVPVRYPHASYAAMISYLDEQIGLLVKQLKDLGIYDNTLIIFTSDNGPTYNGGTDSPWFKSGGPFKCDYGFGKGFVHEGGIRVPMIATWPGNIKPGTVSNHPSTFWDVMPTLCEISGVRPPAGIDGISFLPELKGKPQAKHKYLYWEFPEYGGQQAVLIGKLKAIRQNMQKGNTRWELYDLESDPVESIDIADSLPLIISRVEEIAKSEHIKSANRNWWFNVLGDK
jgi:arylsulfatase A-like enzyme